MALTRLTALILLAALPATAQDIPQLDPAVVPQSDQDPAEVLTRGPVHEAFAEQINADPELGLVVQQAPPEPIDEIPPEYKPEGENIVWIPGYWWWDDEAQDYLWVSGVWRDVPPGQQWVAGYWNEMPDGFRWISGFWQSDSIEHLVYQEPPPASLDNGPTGPAPSDSHFWAPGYWDTDYRWHSGYWHPWREDRVWIPPRWVATPHGCVFLPGHWDYQLADRGQLFAPVRFAEPCPPSYAFQPQTVVQPSILQIHLFVRPQRRTYCFGDYYDVVPNRPIFAYSRFHLRRRGYCPLFAYNRARYARRGVNLGVRLGNWHTYFRTNRNLRPPRTLFAQRDFVRRNRNLTAARQTIVGAQLRDLARRTNRIERGVSQTLRLTRVTAQQRQRQLQTARTIRARSVQRKQREVFVAKRAVKSIRDRLVADNPIGPRLRTPGQSRLGNRAGNNINKAVSGKSAGKLKQALVGNERRRNGANGKPNGPLADRLKSGARATLSGKRGNGGSAVANGRKPAGKRAITARSNRGDAKNPRATSPADRIRSRIDQTRSKLADTKPSVGKQGLGKKRDIANSGAGARNATGRSKIGSGANRTDSGARDLKGLLRRQVADKGSIRNRTKATTGRSPSRAPVNTRSKVTAGTTGSRSKTPAARGRSGNVKPVIPARKRGSSATRSVVKSKPAASPRNVPSTRPSLRVPKTQPKAKTGPAARTGSQVKLSAGGNRAVGGSKAPTLIKPRTRTQPSRVKRTPTNSRTIRSNTSAGPVTRPTAKPPARTQRSTIRSRSNVRPATRTPAKPAVRSPARTSRPASRTSATRTPARRSTTPSRSPASRPVKRPTTPAVRTPSRSVKSPVTRSTRSPASRSTRSPASRPVKRPTTPAVRTPSRSVKSPVTRSTRSPAARSTRSSTPGRSVRSPVTRPSRSTSTRPTRSPVTRPTRSPVTRPTRSPVTRPTRSPSSRPSVSRSRSSSSRPSISRSSGRSRGVSRSSGSSRSGRSGGNRGGGRRSGGRRK